MVIIGALSLLVADTVIGCAVCRDALGRAVVFSAIIIIVRNQQQQIYWQNKKAGLLDECDWDIWSSQLSKMTMQFVGTS